MAQDKIEPKAIGMGLASAAAALGAYLLVIQPEIRKWSANAEEAHRPLPGDDLIPDARAQVTYAVTIEAPASKVWPWLVQMGYGRAGYYSYDRVDVALRKVLPVQAREGGGVPSADRTDRIVPELQHLEVGDVLPALPNAEGGFAVAALEPERYLVLGSYTYTDQRAMREAGEPDFGAPKPKFYWRTSWTFFLEDLGRQTTRMLVRNRADYKPRLLMGPFAWVIAIPLHFVMQRKQLIGIKERAEQSFRVESSVHGLPAGTYRPTPVVRRVNRIVAKLAALGLTLPNTVALRVRGRRSGKMRSTVLTWAEHEGERYLVSLGGESEWVKNIRAAGGDAEIRHGRRWRVRLTEVPVSERAPILEAYLSKRALTKSPERAAREYFGLSPYPTLEQLEPIASRCPVFRIEEYGNP